MVKLFYDKGFTLIEVLVALSILLIISIAFLTLFASSYSDIAVSGMKNKGLYEVQQMIEQTISSGTPNGDKELIISFPGVPQPVKVSGSIQSEEVTVRDKNISISVFVPK